MRSVNKVILIGNLTRDPELRYTPQGHAVCGFGLATNRTWKSDGDKRESTEFHNVVAWNKLAELCSQLLVKGTKVYVEGRLQTRDWVNDTGEKRYKTEVVIEEMVVLASKGRGSDDSYGGEEPEAESSGESESLDDLDDLEDFLSSDEDSE